MKEYLKLIRIKHWLKNGLVFLPIFFSTNLFETQLLVQSIIAFLIFSFTSSIIYVFNDITDIEKDKLHEIKKKRPLASGKISKWNAYIVIIILFIIDLLLSIYLYSIYDNIFVFIIPILYLLLNYLYSKRLKNIPIIDVVILVSGFVFRAMYGGIVTGISVSKYLYLMIIFGAFYLGFGKRRNEIIKNGDRSRKVLELYNENFLDKNMYVMLALAMVSYTLWCVDPTTTTKIKNDYLFWTIPLLIIIFEQYSLNIEGNSHGDPIEVLLSDKKLFITVIIYILVMGGIIYIL